MNGTTVLVQWNNTLDSYSAGELGIDPFNLTLHNRSGIQGIVITGMGYRLGALTSRWQAKILNCDNGVLRSIPVDIVTIGLGLNSKTDVWSIKYVVDKSELCYNGTYNFHFQEITGAQTFNKFSTTYELILE